MLTGLQPNGLAIYQSGVTNWAGSTFLIMKSSAMNRYAGLLLCNFLHRSLSVVAASRTWHAKVVSSSIFTDAADLTNSSCCIRQRGNRSVSKELFSMLSSPGRSDQRPLVPKANHEHPSSSLFPLYEILDLAKETLTPMVQTTPPDSTYQHNSLCESSERHRERGIRRLHA